MPVGPGSEWAPDPYASSLHRPEGRGRIAELEERCRCLEGERPVDVPDYSVDNRLTVDCDNGKTLDSESSALRFPTGDDLDSADSRQRRRITFAGSQPNRS